MWERKSEYQDIGRSGGKIKMLNMDQSKIAEVIGQCIINRYMDNIYLAKHRIIKLFTIMPYTGAPNISDPQSIAVIDDLKKFVEGNYSSPNN